MYTTYVCVQAVYPATELSRPYNQTLNAEGWVAGNILTP